MKKNYVITIVVVLVVLILALWAYSNSKTKRQSNYPTPSNMRNNGTKELFSSSPLSQYAYLISGTDPYDANTQKALAGFTVTKNTLPDGSIQITLNAQKAEYQTQTYTVKTGEKLYFIEKSLMDDNGTEDRFLGDDQAVLVDASGYIVGQPQ